MENKFMKVEEGQKILPPGKDQIQFDLTDGGAILLAQMHKPTAAEARAYKNGVPQFKYTVIDGVLYFLSRFGTLNWTDAPFHRDLAVNATKLPNPKDGEGLGVHVMLVDAATGILKVQRLIGLSTQFTRDLVEEIVKQPIMSRSQYLASVNATYARYSTRDMVEMAEHEN
mgnify:CR=1 FL=1